MSIIVVEGVDASGKSTLLENLRSIPKEYFLLVRHSCRPLSAFHLLSFLRFIEHDTSLLTVVDRHPLISETIYGPLLRNQNLVDKVFTPEQARKRLEKTVSKIIYCRPPVRRIKETLLNRPQLVGVAEHIDQLIVHYDGVMDILARSMQVVRYDYTEPTLTFEEMLGL